MTTAHHDLISRLARIEGQVAALKRTLEAGVDTDCAKTLIQVKAATNGLKRFAEAFSQEHARRCASEKMSRERFADEIDSIITSAFTLS